MYADYVQMLQNPPLSQVDVALSVFIVESVIAPSLRPGRHSWFITFTGTISTRHFVSDIIN